jgi:hypothetical protein
MKELATDLSYSSSPAGSTCSMRWGPGRAQTWRHRGDGGFDGSCYEVTELAEVPARAFVTTRHYEGSWPAAVRRFGLVDVRQGGCLVGAAILSIPSNRKVLTNVFPGLRPYEESLELGRLILDDSVASNGETWFLARVFQQAAAAGIRGIVSFADPVPRLDEHGRTRKAGHIGVCYLAKGGYYTGRSAARSVTVLRTGQVLSDRALQKVRAQETGHAYVERMLIQHGAAVRRAGQAPAGWLTEALAAAGARRQPHGGKHRYAFRLGSTRRDRCAVVIAPALQPRPTYPDLPAPPELDLGLD